MPRSSGSAPTPPASSPGAGGASRCPASLIAAAVAGSVGYAASFVIARFRHLALIMITLGLGVLLHEAANQAHWLTGGADGLQGVRTWPLLRPPAASTCTATRRTPTRSPSCSSIFLAARRMTNSPFGLALRGIRENATRMPAIGAPSRAHVRRVYTMAAVIAGVAGALLAQTTETVALEVLSFQRSAELLVMLVLGGAGRLYGGLVGAIIFMVARDRFSGINPQYWYFWIGLLLVIVVMLLPNGILGGLARIAGRAAERGLSAPALSTRGLDKSFGSLVVASDVALTLPPGERYALIGPNGAGKTTLINLMTGMLPPDRGRIFLGERGDHGPQPRAARQARARAHLPDQHALPAPQRAGGGDARGLRAAGRARASSGGALPAYREAVEEAHAILGSAPARRALAAADPRARLRPAAAARDRARARHPPAGAPARRAGRRRAPRRERGALRRDRRPVAGHRGALHRARHGRRVPVRAAHHRHGRRRGSWSRAAPTRSPRTRACARSTWAGAGHG